MERRQVMWILAGLGVSVGSGRACLWDTDTLREEFASRPTMWDLLLGQFPHHGDAYYRTRVSRISKGGDLGVVELNDLAVAQVRLGEFAKAWKALAKAKEIDPDHYETLSNMGVTAKKEGDFEKGAEFIAAALKLKPEGHMGLGDWYLKALRWRTTFEEATEKAPPASNFLGKPYADTFVEKHYGMGERPSEVPKLDAQYEQLIRNDQSFADGFMLVGDALTYRRDLNLSFYAYTRAMMLGHQNPVEVRRRRRTFLKYYESYSRKHGGSVRGVSFWKSEIAKAEKKINMGLAWLKQFKSVEAELLKGKEDERVVDVEKVEVELLARGIRRALPA